MTKGLHPMTMKELAERVEAATGPDRELDGEISRLLDMYPRGSLIQPPFTASLDAAMTLRPKGWGFTIRSKSVELEHPGYPKVICFAATPALALCAAALKARASQEPTQ